MAKTQFDRQRFEARIGSKPTHIVDRHWRFNNPWNSHNDGRSYTEKMLAEGIWKRCEECGAIFNPIYGHEHATQEVTQN